MKLVKTRLRTKLGDDFLRHCLIVYIERDIAEKFCVEEIIEAFDLCARKAEFKTSNLATGFQRTSELFGGPPSLRPWLDKHKPRRFVWLCQSQPASQVLTLDFVWCLVKSGTLLEAFPRDSNMRSSSMTFFTKILLIINNNR
jgi:hypothetical protein